MASCLDQLAIDAVGPEPRSRGLEPELPGVFSFGVKADFQNAGSVVGTVARLHDDGARTVPEQHRHVASLGREVQPRGMHFASHDQDPLEHLRTDEAVGHGQGVDEPAALCAKIETGDLGDAESLVQKERGSREVRMG